MEREKGTDRAGKRKQDDFLMEALRLIESHCIKSLGCWGGGGGGKKESGRTDDLL